jgi:histidyl-tRNA synthetase
MFKACGVPQDKFRTICSAVDKMDKSSWESVRKEIIAKGVDEEAAEKIGEYVTRTIDGEILKELQEDALLMKTSSAAEGVEDLILLRQYCKFFGVLPKVKVDLSLARGLDYYTGVIFEANLLGASEEVTEFGSLCGGGRYDDLVKRFDPKGQFDVPCVGFSIGLDRLFDIVDKKSKAGRVRTVETDVYVISGPKDLLTDRMSLCAELWDHGINAEMSYKGSVKLLTQFQHCEKEDIPFQVIVGEEEKKSESVKIRKTVNKEECIVKRREVVHHLKKKLQEYHSECH